MEEAERVVSATAKPVFKICFVCFILEANLFNVYWAPS